MDASKDIAHFTGNSRIDFGDMSDFGTTAGDLIEARKRSPKKQKLTRAGDVSGKERSLVRPEFTDAGRFAESAANAKRAR
ncbi:hypothetical protein [Candidatus Burkholderia verschuerenii]|uniref:hypothetical protein n=1 Tax=Candidatus Burkholderia verschuerenii TaxID=242163 RepID=UPI0012ED4B26|nr:hypothetical protein [Candidatus Burkholderia verschuerenii]